MRGLTGYVSIVFILIVGVISHAVDLKPPEGVSWEEWHMTEEYNMPDYTPEQFFDVHDIGQKGYFDAKDILAMYGLNRDEIIGRGDGMGDNEQSQVITDEMREKAVKLIMQLLDVDDDTRITRDEYLNFASKGNKFIDLGVGVGHRGDFETEYEMHHWNEFHKDIDPDIKNVHKEDVEHELLHHEHEVEEDATGPEGATKGTVVTDDEMEVRIESDRIPQKYKADFVMT